MRSRNIKPGFFLNEYLAECDALARILFTGLWCLADREGRLENRPARIKAAVLPFDNVDVNELLAQLAKRGFIRRYTVDGATYIDIPRFRSHQNPHRNEAESVLPPFPEEGAEPQPAPSPEPKQQKVAKVKQPRPRNELFDAVAEITGSDVKASGGYVAKVANLLRGAEPPYSPDEVRSLPAALRKSMPFLSGKPITLSMVEKYIGWVRKPPPTDAPGQTEDRSAIIAKRAAETAAWLQERERLKRERQGELVYGENAAERSESRASDVRSNAPF